MRLAHHLLRHASGVFHFRLIVPVDLQALLGRRVIKQSLRTRDPALARWWAYTLGASLAQSLSAPATVTSAPITAAIPSRPRAIGLAADQWLKSIETETLRKTLTIKSAAIMGFARHVGMKKPMHGEVVRDP